MKNKNLKFFLAGLVLLQVVPFLLSIWMPLGEAFRLFYGLIFITIVPGLAMTFFFFRPTVISSLERFFLAIVFSISIVPMVIYFLSKMGMEINTLTTFVTIMFITALFSLFSILRLFLSKKPSKEN